MKGIIIAGGFGTRMRPLTYNRPKHLLPVANRPFLEYQVAFLRRHGVEQIVFATNYCADQIEAHFGDGSRFGVEMRYALETEPLGTGGAIRNAASLVPDDAVVVLNGDILTDFDLSQIIEFHKARGAAATIALRAVERPHGFGALATEPGGRISAWREPSEEEKKRVAESGGQPTGDVDHINAGIYVLEPDVIRRIPMDRPVSVERETYPALLAAGVPIYGLAPEGYWIDMGRPEQYLLANAAVLSRIVRTDVPYQQFGEDAQIHPEAQIDFVTSVGAGARVGAGSRLSECIILDGVSVGARATLNRTIVDKRAELADEVSSRGGAVVAQESVIGRGTRL